jgi:hypothetical protein
VCIAVPCVRHPLPPDGPSFAVPSGRVVVSTCTRRVRCARAVACKRRAFGPVWHAPRRVQDGILCLPVLRTRMDRTRRCNELFHSHSCGTIRLPGRLDHNRIRRDDDDVHRLALQLHAPLLHIEPAGRALGANDTQRSIPGSRYHGPLPWRAGCDCTLRCRWLVVVPPMVCTE